MRDTYEPAGTPVNLPVTSSHAAPSLFVNHTRPSSVPANKSPGRIGDSFSDTTVPNVSAPVTSGVMPPVVRSATCSLAESAYESSGETGNISSPYLTLLSTRLAPKYNVAGLCLEMMYGVFQFHRSAYAMESVR